MTQLDLSRLGSELEQRSVALNDQPLRANASYVLVWLQQTIRGHDHPAIDAGITLANQLGLPVLVYHGVRADYPHASDRLHRFLLGASRAMAATLAQRGIASAHYVEREGCREKGLVYRLAEHAAAVVADQHVTFVGRIQAESFAAKADLAVIATDAARMIPFKALPAKGLHATKAFRAAHSPLLHEWRDLRTEVEPQQPAYTEKLPFSSVPIASMSDAELDQLIAKCPIDHSLPASKEHPADVSAVAERLANLTDKVAPNYRRDRNNPALSNGSSQMSPYLHFGMTSPWEVMRAAEAADVSASARWKFNDELLTWREWAHWRMQVRPDFTDYESLPKAARDTMDAHRDDPRELVDEEKLWRGESPDETWNTAQKQWLLTGWMHNNLRMYWSKQMLRWTVSPERAWYLACAMNDRLSLDGRDPATYVCMRSSFGEGRPGYREIPIYGKTSPKSDTAIRKRTGMIAWIEDWASKEPIEISVSPVP